MAGAGDMFAADIARGLDLSRNGHGYIGRCPSCGYGGAFTVRDRDGVTLVRCHVGCDQPHLIDALRRAGLWGRAKGDVGTLVTLMWPTQA